MSDLDVLWQPIKLGSLTVPNRIFVAAHETYLAANRSLTDRYVTYLAERARGGAGLVTIGASAVHPRGAANGHLQAWHPENVPMYAKLAAAVHAHGGHVFSQLFHCGHQGNGQLGFDWEPPFSASNVQGPSYDRQPEPMSLDDIDEVVQAFGRSAALVAEGGLDGVELSGGHGYLIGQFISPFTNHRTDGYGGSIENRCRLAIEIATEIRRTCGRTMPLGIRISYDEYLGDVGITPDESDATIATLHATGLFDYFNISGINYHTVHHLVPPMTAGLDGHMVVNAKRAKAVIQGGVPIMTVTAIQTIERAAEIVAAGDADLVGMVRAHMADPDIVRKARDGRANEIRRCVGANQGCVRRGGLGKGITCTVNPAVGREAEWGQEHEHPAAASLRVLVVGGGPAGMKAAESAARRGHAVTLVEREAVLGGTLRLAGSLPGRARWQSLIDDLGLQLELLGVDVRLNTTADVHTVRDLAADAIVLATGAAWDRTGWSTARPDRAGIPGADGPNVIDPSVATADPDRVGRRVVIVDEHGDHTALSLARLLGEAGRSVQVVTHQMFVGAMVAATVDIPFLMPALAAAGVTLTPQSFVERISADEVDIVDMWGTTARTVPVDTVILNLGRHADVELSEALAAVGIASQRIGDGRVPREVDDAIYEGERCGRTLTILAPLTGATAA